MATPEEIQRLLTEADKLTEKEDEIRTRLDKLEEANEQLLSNIDIARDAATRASDPTQVAALNKRATDLQAQLTQGLSQEKQLADSLKAVAQQANQARTRARVAADAAAAAPAPKPDPALADSAGQIVQDDASASGPNAAGVQTVGPDGRVTTPENTGPTNAVVTPTAENPEGVTSGTDATVKTTEQTQAQTTESNNGQALKAPSADAPGVGGAVIKEGVAEANDDGGSSATPQQAVDANTTAQPNVKPRPNVLDQYASYSYSASVYLMTEAQYARLLGSKTKSIDGYQLLFQSGGAANNVGGERTPALRSAANADNDFNNSAPVPPDGGRNPFFDNDFYIDSITIENLPPGKSTGSAHNVSGLKFTVVEPNGITLLDRLYDAVANSAPQSADGKVNYTAATYLMVIRFYGYDSEGNLEQVRSKPDQEGTSDPSSIIEKFVPFKIKSINWGVGSKLVSYEWDCTPIGQMIAGFASRGTIPYDVQLVDSTVGGLLGGDVAYSNATTSAANPGASTTLSPATNSRDAQRQAIERRNQSTAPNQSAAETARLNRQAGNSATPTTPPAPPKANAAPSDKKSITKGLVGAMNEFQKKLVKDGVFTYADEYVIKFIGPDANKIKDAKLQLPNAKVEKKSTAAGKQDPQALDQRKSSVDMISRSFSITAGQQLLQAIELTIRNSSYIYDQAVVIINPDGTQVPNPNSRNQPLKWFVITMTAEKISPELDPKRNDYAYRITYSIASREVKNVISKYFPVSRFSGVHKSYPYWFTGENTAVLEYQETLNAMYQLTVSGSDTEGSAAQRTRQQFTSSMSDIVTYNYAPRSTESSSGASGKQNELGANAAEVLYSPGDLRECKVKIVGDPAWIMQGSNFREPTDEYFSGESVNTGFLPDGSIAFDNQDVLFEIRWQRPNDYDLDTGLADPYSQTQKKYNNRTALQSRVYLCKRVVSEFRQGRFEQTLEGALYLFPVPDKSNTANPAAANNATDKSGNTVDDSINRAEAAKLARQGQGGTGAGGGRGSPGFNENDPRRLDRGDGGKAAILGAQANAKKAPAPGELGSGTFATPSGPGLSGQLGSGTFSVENAPPPGAPTSGTGESISSVPTSVPSGPQKLPASGTPPGQIAAQVVATQRLRDRTSAASGSPESSSIPSKQPMARQT
jgi:hypothetical protein